MKIDIQKEEEHLINYISTHWEGADKETIAKLISATWKKSLILSKLYFENNSGFIEICRNWFDERKNFSFWQKQGTLLNKDTFNQYVSYDVISQFIIHIIMAPEELKNEMRKEMNLDKTSQELISNIKKEIGYLPSLKPIGWTEFKKDYVDYKGMGTYSYGIYDGFLDKNGSSYPFHIKTSLPHVMYDDLNQRRNPYTVLVGAILSQAYAISSYNTQLDLISDFNHLKNKLNSPKYYQTIVLNIDKNLIIELENPISRKIFKIGFNSTLLPQEKIIHIEEEIKDFSKTKLKM